MNNDPSAPAEVDYRIRDRWDNDEFLTGATVDLIEDVVVVETESFTASSEFPNDGDATAQAISFAVAWVESRTTTIEDRLGPFGIEWAREQIANHYPQEA